LIQRSPVRAPIEHFNRTAKSLFRFVGPLGLQVHNPLMAMSVG
jgi:hypothetical protein